MARSYVMMRERDNGTAGCVGGRCPARDGERVGRFVVLLVVLVGGVPPARSPRATFAPIGRHEACPAIARRNLGRTAVSRVLLRVPAAVRRHHGHSA